MNQNSTAGLPDVIWGSLNLNPKMLQEIALHQREHVLQSLAAQQIIYTTMCMFQDRPGY